MKPEAVLLIAGEGGHLTQMKRLLKRMQSSTLSESTTFLGLWEKGRPIESLDGYHLLPVRNKHSIAVTISQIPRAAWYYLVALFQLQRRYRIRGVISTGPGIAVIPSIVFRLLGARVVFIETWSRFDTHSWTGRLMYRVAQRFYVQNREQLDFYPKAQFRGRL